MRLFGLILTLVFSSIAHAGESTWNAQVPFVWVNQDRNQALTYNPHSKEWTPKSKKTWESFSGKASRNWSGHRLSTLINNYLESIPLESRVSVDLVLVHGKDGKVATIPRGLLNKYSIGLMKQVGLKNSGLNVILPRRSSPRIQKEVLPLGNYEVSNVEKVVLTDYRSFYSGQYFVGDQGNPIVARGQKRFIQTCLGCHSSAQSEFLSKVKISKMMQTPGTDAQRGLASVQHPASQGLPEFSDVDYVAIDKYVEALLPRISQQESQTASASGK